MASAWCSAHLEKQATKTGPPSPSSHHLISLFPFTAEFLKEDVYIYCLNVLQSAPVSPPKMLFLKSAVCKVEGEKKEVGWHCCSRLLPGPRFGRMSGDKCAVCPYRWGVLERICGESSLHCFFIFVTLNVSINIEHHSPRVQ